MKQAQQVIAILCKELQLTKEEMFAKKRNRDNVLARQLFSKWLRDNAMFTLKRIGTVFGQDHTTAIHSINTAQNLIDTDEMIRDLWHRIKAINRDPDLIPFTALKYRPHANAI